MCTVPPLKRNTTGGRVQVFLVSVMREDKILNPNDSIHYRYSPKSFVSNEFIVSIGRVFSILDSLDQSEKEYFARLYQQEITASTTADDLISNRKALQTAKKVTNELDILCKSSVTQAPTRERRIFAESAKKEDLFSDIDAQLSHERKMKEATAALADFLPDVVEDFKKSGSPIGGIKKKKKKLQPATNLDEKKFDLFGDNVTQARKLITPIRSGKLFYFYILENCSLDKENFHILIFYEISNQCTLVFYWLTVNN